ncbi:MAG: UDP-N-acetylmuramate dehydrogenase [Candidatus Niyogibacteria bacterium]|nr:UDP-N-acetylmuramate dehydrogenase [Candidatus Niyogibacteria bacterium]
MGAGSNVLVSDKGFDGLVIKNRANSISVDFGSPQTKLYAEAGLAAPKLYAEAGAQMARVVAESVKAGLAGFEWAIGIPGTIGGSVRGNAGCFGSEMKDVIESVEVFDSEASKSYQLKAKSCEFGYRHSIFKHNPDLIILSTTLKLRAGDSKKSQSIIAEYAKKRALSQDIGQKCAGCIFKNVEWSRKDIHKSDLCMRFSELRQFSDKPNIPAAFLIDQLGLKGKQIGGAKISGRHANYFINIGGATAEDVLTLITIAKEKVQNHYGVFLETEIQLL